jgi:archaellin
MKKVFVITAAVTALVACGTTEPRDVTVHSETMVHETTDSVADALQVDTVTTVNGLLDALGKQ